MTTATDQELKDTIAELMITEFADYEPQARQRVSDTPELDEYSEVIFFDWPNWREHMQWIATAPIAEIVDWAETVDDD